MVAQHLHRETSWSAALANPDGKSSVWTGHVHLPPKTANCLERLIRFQPHPEAISRNVQPTPIPVTTFSPTDLLLGPVHVYPDVFESTAFSFLIQKSPRPHVAY